MTLKAIIFDVDGTLADTEVAHMNAFNEAFSGAGLDWYWDLPTYTDLLKVSGGKERMHHYWSSLEDGATKPSKDEIETLVPKLHKTKTAAYERMVAEGRVIMRPGVLEMIQSAKEDDITLAIATTTSPANIEALLTNALGADWRQTFAVVEDAETAPNKKPDPSVYIQAVQRLGVEAKECIAFEDTANGLRAATAAGVATVITPNEFSIEHDFSGAAKVISSMEEINLRRLENLLDMIAHY